MKTTLIVVACVLLAGVVGEYFYMEKLKKENKLNKNIKNLYWATIILTVVVGAASTFIK